MGVVKSAGRKFHLTGCVPNFLCHCDRLNNSPLLPKDNHTLIADACEYVALFGGGGGKKEEDFFFFFWSCHMTCGLLVP